MNQEWERDREGYEEEIDLRELFSVILKWKWMIVMVTIASVVVAGLVSFFVLSPIYESKTVLMAVTASEKLNYQKVSDENLEGVVNTISRLPEMTLNTYLGQLKNTALMEAVLKSTGLDKAGYTPNMIQSTIKGNIVKDTNLIEVTVSHTDPVIAALIANTLSEEFVKFISEKNRTRTNQSLVLLQEQIKISESELALANQSLMDFNRSGRSIKLIEEELNTAIDNLVKYKSLLTQTRIDKDQSQAAYNKLEESLINTPAYIIDGSDTVPNPVYTNLMDELNKKQIELTEHDASMTAIINEINYLEEDIKYLQTELTEKKMEEEKILREVRRLEHSHELFTDRIAQNQVLQSLDIGENSILIMQPATEQYTPVKPNKKLNMAIALILGLMIGIFLAFILELFDNYIKTPEDVAKHLDLPVIGSIPESD